MEESENIVPIANEDDGYSNDDLFNITSWGADMSFRELINMYDDDELLKPELQRKYVWDRAEASRFIDSILLGLPIPSIFLANTIDNNKLIIDGYQRIMTVYDYVKNGIFAKDGKIFRLTNTEKINIRWRGKAYSELIESDQKKIRQTTIHSIIFEQKHPKDNDTSLFQIFERINTSGKVLKPQEIRNCVYQGNMNSMLIELNKYPTWRKMYGTEVEDSRMSDMEFILRFFALSSKDLIGKKIGQISLKLTLNNYMGDKKNHSISFLEGLRKKFKKVIDIIFTYIGENAFRNYSPEGLFVKKFHPTIFDSVIISTNYAIERGIDISKIDNLEEKHLQLLQDDEFKRFTTERTTNLENINGRINLACQFLFNIKYE